MEPAGIRLDLVEGVARLPDEVRVKFEGRRPLYSDCVEQVRVKEMTVVVPGQPVFVRVRAPSRKRLWVGRDERWITTAVRNTRGDPVSVKVTNVSDSTATISAQTVVGLWLLAGAAPRQLGFVSIGSRRYREWQGLLYKSEPERVLQERRQEEQAAGEANAPPDVVRRP